MSMISQTSLFFLGMILWISMVSQATAQVFGHVNDVKGQPIPGAHVQVRPSGEVCRTNPDGYFIFRQLYEADTIIISHVAFVSDSLFNVSSGKAISSFLKEGIFSFEDIVITPGYDPYVQLVQASLQTRVLNSSQEVLKLVPGLFIGQHAGGGKAEQLFLRGFDLDHGTDIAITVDNMPVNMVSHAHGQGYADLHFLIPETVGQLQFGKGPYDVNSGNFNVAGNVQFLTRALFDQQIKMEFGQFGTRRILGMVNLFNNDRHQMALAIDGFHTEGPFESPQGLRKYNVFLKDRWTLGNGKRLGLRMMGFKNTWSASGQIPQRLVNSGLISRFGAVDDTEGGATRRRSVSVDFSSTNTLGTFFSQIDLISYDFELFSNFTFFLNDSIDGDQIRQAENREMLNAIVKYERDMNFLKEGSWFMGLGYRYDMIDNSELSRTIKRRPLHQFLRSGDIGEWNLSGYVGLDWSLGRWSFSPAIRIDHLNFSYQDHLENSFTETSKGFVSPKVKMVFHATPKLDIEMKMARGFHSNDSRVTAQSDTLKTLPAAYSVDIGGFWRPGKKIFLDATFYHSYLEQEFVYVGDEGIVEPSNQGIRSGFDVGLRFQVYPGMFFNADLNTVRARFVGEGDQNFVPLAPALTYTFGLDYDHPVGFRFGLNYSYLANRPANEENSITAFGYGLTSMKCAFQFPRFKVGIEIQNLLDIDWNEAQFATRSRLSEEHEPVEELHFTPGTPFFLKGSISYNF